MTGNQILQEMLENGQENWDRFHERINSHPDELLQPYSPFGDNVSEAKYTTFHLMCHRHMPIGIIEFAIEKRPAVVSNLGNGGYSPLFQACISMRNDIIMLLLELYPEAAGIGYRGRNFPAMIYVANIFELHDFVEENLEVCKKLVEAYPLDRGIVINILKNQCFTSWKYCSDAYRKNMFPFVALFLRQLLFYGSGSLPRSRNDESRLLHYMFSSYFVRELTLEARGFLEHAVRYYKHHLLTQNDYGETPLFIWIKNGVNNEAKRTILLELLMNEPLAACVPNRSVRLPFYQALVGSYRTWMWYLRSLLDVAPKACCTRNIESRMYPFMEAAADKRCDLSTVFSLLKEHPKAACGLLTVLR